MGQDAPRLIRVGRPAMGSLFEIYAAGENLEALERSAYAALDRVDWLEQQLSPYRPDSDIRRLNVQAYARPAPVSPALFALLLRLRKLSAETEGAFDCTAGKLVRAWGFFRQGLQRGEPVTSPDSEVISTLAQQIGWRYVELEEATQTVRFLTPEIEFHLGAVGKGYIVQCAADFLRAEGVTCALLHSGQSSVVALGAPLDSAGWTIGLTHPQDSEQRVGQITLRDAALSTSGSAEQYLLAEGRRISHLFDPRTGQPIESNASVTVLSPDATEGDALGTAFLVQGVSWTQTFCQSRPTLGAVFLIPDAAHTDALTIEPIGNMQRMII